MIASLDMWGPVESIESHELKVTCKCSHRSIVHLRWAGAHLRPRACEANGCECLRFENVYGDDPLYP